MIIFGASIAGNQLFELLKVMGGGPSAYCDNNPQKWNTKFNGVPVISVEDAKRLTESDPTNYAFIVASCFYEIMYNQLKSMGVTSDIYLYLLYDPLGCKLKATPLNESQKIEACNLYEFDVYTQRLLRKILFNGFGWLNALAPLTEHLGFSGIDEYYYDDISQLVTDEDLTFIDGGAYIGDSLEQMKRVFGDRIKFSYVFEPNDENFARISEIKDDRAMALYKKALYNREGILHFTKSGPFFRAADMENDIDNGNEQVETVALDDLDFNKAGKYILKLDIEGSELKALQGAVNFIKKYRPYMAICVYHKIGDILQLPKYIKSLVPDYKFLLRGGMHTVCYAFPGYY